MGSDLTIDFLKTGQRAEGIEKKAMQNEKCKVQSENLRDQGFKGSREKA